MKLKKLGFNVKDFPVNTAKGGLVVEGDVFITEDQINGMYQSLDDKQKRFTTLIGCKNARNITIKSTLNKKSVPHRQLAGAVKGWNRVLTQKIHNFS